MSGVAGIVLTGGRSSRMGRAKASLPWQGLPLVAHVAGVLREVLDGPVVVVRAPGQQLPALPVWTELAEDAREGRGPLEGIAAGLRAVAGRAEAAFISATDVPLLHPAFVRRVVRALDPDVDAAVPRVAGRVHPLASACRTRLLPLAERLLARELTQASLLFREARVRWLDERALLSDPAVRAGDPQLDSLRNLNTPDEYQAVLELAAGRCLREL